MQYTNINFDDYNNDVKNESEKDNEKKVETKVSLVPNNILPSPKPKKKPTVKHFKIRELDTDLISPKSESDYNSSKIVVIGKSGTGKCLGYNTEIFLFNGSKINVQDVRIGDLLMGDNLTPRTVLGLGRGKSEMFRVLTISGDEFISNGDHILCLKTSFLNHSNDFFLNEMEEYRKSDGIYEMSVRSFLSLPDYIRAVMRIYKINDTKLLEFGVESIGEDNYYGFELNGNGRFVLGNFIVTHNTTIIKSLIYEKSHIIPIGMVFSGTEDSNHFWKSIFPDTFVFNGLDMDKLESFVRRQRIAKQYLKNPWSILLLDDVMDDPKILNRPFFHGMYKNGRHYGMVFILSSQYAMDIRPAIRTNIDCTFILREPNFRNRKCIWENYASVIPDFRDFCNILDQITTDYTSLVVLNNIQSNNWQDCVFWYKAKPVPRDWKFGCKEFWEFHKDRYNNEYRDIY